VYTFCIETLLSAYLLSKQLITVLPDCICSGLTMTCALFVSIGCNQVYIRGIDKLDRVVMYMRPKNENTGILDNQMKHLVYNMERARHIIQV
jgi:L-cysteine desulfidase